jgi:hypothetical protein
VKTETFDSAADFLAALKPKKRGRATRPDIPSAGRAERTGLSTLILAGWSIEFIPNKGYRLYKVHGPSTAFFGSEAAACVAAREGK